MNLTRYPYLLLYRPRHTFKKLNYSKSYRTPSPIVPKIYFFEYPETDIVRKCCPIQTPQSIMDLYKMYIKLYRRTTPNATNTDIYSSHLESNVRRQIDQYCKSLFEESFEMWFYYALCFPEDTKQPITSRKFNMKTDSPLFPRIYTYNLFANEPYVDMEALVDLILYTPGLYKHYHNGIVNQSPHLYVYTEDKEYIPFSVAIQDGLVRPNAYWNKQDDIGWRQSWNSSKNDFETVFLTKHTYTKFMVDMREIIHWLHQHRIVYLDWRVQNIGYSELDKKFKLFDFDAITLVKREQFVKKPICKTYKQFCRNVKTHPENYSMSSRHMPMSAYEIDWNLFYDMLKEIVEV